MKDSFPVIRRGTVSPQDFIDNLSIGADGWIGAWVAVGLAVAPDFFSLEANPWYYIMGLVCLFFSVRGLVQYCKLK